jgi:uncharacterized membrane protein
MEIFLFLVLVVVWIVVRSRDKNQRDVIDAELRNRLYTLERQLDALKTAPAKPVQASSVSPAESLSPKPIVPEPAAMPVAEVASAADFVQQLPVAEKPTVTVAPATHSAEAPHSPAPPRAETHQPEPSPPVADRAASLEERLGANWLNKLGIVILVFGVAFFLAYQLKNLGPLGKTVVGFAVSATLLVGGLVLERRDKYRIFARTGIGGGWALTFFTTYAMYHIRSTHVLDSQALDLVLMLAVAIGMVVHSLRYQSQVVTELAFLLAFSTVTISSDEGFSLLASALLAVGLVVVTSRQHWAELELAGLIAVYANHFVWLHRVLAAHGGPGHPFPEFLYSFALLVLDWMIFRVAYVLRLPRDRKEDLLTSVTAVLNSGGLLGLLSYQSAHPEWSFWLLLALGAAEMMLAFLARPRRRTPFIVLSTIASGLLLAAIPYRYQGSHWSVLWLLEAEVLFIAGLRMREVVFRRLGILAGFGAAFQLTLGDVVPVFTSRAAYPDASRHWAAALALAGGAAIYWFNAQAAPRRWPELLRAELDAIALRMTSYLGLLAAVAAIWVFFPGSQTAVAWMVLVVALGLCGRPMGLGGFCAADGHPRGFVIVAGADHQPESYRASDCGAWGLPHAARGERRVGERALLSGHAAEKAVRLPGREPRSRLV